MKKTVNEELSKISDWLVSNALSLNVNKSTFLYFRSKKQKNDEQLNLHILNSNIEQKQVVKYLGVYIDDQVNWKGHIQNVRKKIQQGIGILHKAKFLVPHNFLPNLYSSFIQPHMLYGNLAWASPNSNKVGINQLITKSHKIIKKYNKNPNLPNFDQLYIIECCKLVHNHHTALIPPNLKHLFTPTNNVHNHFTRQTLNGMHVPHQASKLFPLRNLATSKLESILPILHKSNFQKYSN